MVAVQRKPDVETCLLILGRFFCLLTFALTPFRSQRFLHQLNRLNHFLKVAAVEPEILFQARPRQSDLFADGVDGFTQFLGIITFFALGF